MVTTQSPFQTIDDRMLNLIDILKDKGVIKFRKDFCHDIGIEKQNLSNIKNGRRSFTVQQIHNACKVYKVNPSWIFGYSNEIFRNYKSKE